MTVLKVGSRLVGDGHPCFVIAEAGSNHNGNLEQAYRLVDVAAESGVDAVKFQIFRAQRLYPRGAGFSDYLQVPRSIYDIVAELEMPLEWISVLANYCVERGVQFLASGFDEASVDALDPYVEGHKIASYEMTHYPLLRHVAAKGKPIFMSTGASELSEVADAVEELQAVAHAGFALMQCTAAYPAPLDSLNIRAIATMRQAFGVPVGFSDHSRDPKVGPIAAVAVGANLIEKHFTLSNRLPGPDHKFALEPLELAAMIETIRSVEQALGSGEKVVHPIEVELRGFARRSVFTLRSIAEGDVFTSENIAVLRCGKLTAGIAPRHYPNVLGRRATRTLPAEQAVQNGDYA